MMRWVSNMMNPQKIMAPATEITNSMASLQKNIWEGGRKEGREGGWEEGRVGGREGGWEEGREGGRVGGKRGTNGEYL